MCLRCHFILFLFLFLAELVVDKAMELRFVGGVYGGNIKPTPFLCLTLKMLQIQPEKDIIVEFIKNEDFKWVKCWLANVKASISVVQNLALVKTGESNGSHFYRAPRILLLSSWVCILLVLMVLIFFTFLVLVTPPPPHPCHSKSISQIHWTYIKHKWVPNMLVTLDAQRWRKLHCVVDKQENLHLDIGSCLDSVTYCDLGGVTTFSELCFIYL